MLKGKDIICISSIDWDFVWQGHQEIMSAFARAGNRVLFIENTGIRAPGFSDLSRLKKRIISWFRSTKGFRKETDNLYIYSPVSLPFPYSRLAQWFNRRMLIHPIKNWLKVMDFQRPIVWTFLPTRTALDIAESVDKSLLVYYCIANFYELAGNPGKVRRSENELIKRSDLVFAQGSVLEEKCLRLNNNAHIFPFGVNVDNYTNFRPDPSTVPIDIKNIPRPIVGYIGGVHKHIDFALLEAVALARPEWSVVLVGPIQCDTGRLQNLKNVFFLGKKDFSKLPNYLNEFSVCIIPYVMSGYTDTVYPTKLNEYHAMGKPVVSTGLPEVIKFNRDNGGLVRVTDSAQGFIDSIDAALGDRSKEAAAARIRSAEDNRWSNRIEKMSALIEEAVVRNDSEPVDWRAKMINVYRRARRKITKIAVAGMIAYSVIFCTPLVWWMAQPLKISMPPQPADCIVVFAGGVGESGHAGQGYEERVQYAVELYKAGFARHIIFSSGYSYAFHETLVMKALAVSLGVPETAITLEEAAQNTYENVEFSRDILVKFKWKNIILVSSPYNMRRAALVFHKLAPEIQVVYAPIPRSGFYGSSQAKGWRGIKLYQISGIAHEYLGIVYYFFKGYI